MGGYAEFASFIGVARGLSIYKRFASLNAKNLLYLQAELVNLEAELKNIELEDTRSEDEEKELFSCSVFHMKRSYQMFGKDGNHQTKGPMQWLKVLEIRRLLKEYSPYHLPSRVLMSF